MVHIPDIDVCRYGWGLPCPGTVWLQENICAWQWCCLRCTMRLHLDVEET
jgi:hypothetical protein